MDLYFKFLSLALFLALLNSCGKDGGFAPGTGGGTSSGSNTKIIFLTATSLTDGNIGGKAGADTVCQSDTNIPNSGVYRALIVDDNRRACTTANCSGGAGEGLDWVLKANTTYTRSDNTIIGTTNSAAIFSFPLTNSISTTASVRVFTGLSIDWTTASQTCTNWTSNDSNSGGVYGDPTKVTSFAIGGGISICDGSGSDLRLYCVEQQFNFERQV